MQDDPQIPIPQVVAQKQKMAFAQPGRQRDRNQIGDIRARQKVEVMIFGDYKTVAFWRGAIDGAVNFENDGALVKPEAIVFIRPINQVGLAFK